MTGRFPPYTARDTANVGGCGHRHRSLAAAKRCADDHNEAQTTGVEFVVRACGAPGVTFALCERDQAALEGLRVLR